MPSVRQAAPGPRRDMVPRGMERGPANFARQRGGSERAIVGRGQFERGAGQAMRRERSINRSINRGQRDMVRQKDFRQREVVRQREITRQRDANRQRDLIRQKGSDRPGLARRTPAERDLTTGSAKRPGFARERNDAIRNSVLRNRAFTERSAREPGARALPRATFRGKFAERGKNFDHRWAGRHHRHRHAFVIGWIGPVFWPYAYDDFVDYTYAPYAYDTFWPYAYDDVYVSIFGPYAYTSSAYANAPAYREGGGTQGRAQGRAQVRVPQRGVAEICSVEASGLTDWPIQRITQAVEPNEAQQAALAELKDATARAVKLMQSACPNDLPATPTGRLAAMRVRLDAMMQAVAIVRPALDRFYGSLSDEQKSRFNALSDDQPAGRGNRTAARQRPDLTQACSGEVTASLPLDRIRQGVRPTEDQRAALDALNDASQKAAELLRATCENDQSLTPTGRVAAMERRLKAMLEAIDIVQPALERFYGSLNDEQKAQFNRLDTRQASRR